MSEKQTRCPKCLTIYKVSLTQLTVAQGMVCCPKCNLNFNALTNLLPVEEIRHTSGSVQSQAGHPGGATTVLPYNEQNILDIFHRKIENSNIDLLTYLNNLNYFQNDEIASFPQLNLAEGASTVAGPHDHDKNKHGWRYYLVWGLVNLSLLGILVFQILWFNPKIMHNSPGLSAVFNHICDIFNCNKLEEKYTFLTINKLKVVAIDRNTTRFSGVLINYHDKSLELPYLRLSLKSKEQSTSILLKPQDYLIESLAGIQRIPKNSPFRFEFTVNQPRKSFEDYSLEIVHP